MFSVYLHSHAKPLQPFQNTFIHCDFSGSSFKYVRVCCKLRKRPRGHVSVFVSVSCNVYVVFHVGAVVSWSDCSIIELVPFISQPRWCVTQGLLRSADHFFKELGKLVFSAFLFSPHFWLVGVFFVLCCLSPVIYLFLLQILSLSVIVYCKVPAFTPAQTRTLTIQNTRLFVLTFNPHLSQFSGDSDDSASCWRRRCFVHEFVVVREFEDDTAEGGGVANR